MTNPMKKMGIGSEQLEAIGGSGLNPGAAITLNVKNLHIHMDERMTSNNHYHCGNEPEAEPFDEYMDQGDWDEDEEDSADGTNSAESADSADDAGCKGSCEHCADCKEKDEETKPQPVVKIKAATTVGDLAACIHDKSGIDPATIYRVLECFFDSCDECVECERKYQEKQALKSKKDAAKKGAAYED